MHLLFAILLFFSLSAGAADLYVFAGQSNALPNPDDTQIGAHGSFVARMAELRPGADVILISAAVGGSKMAAWRKDWRTTSYYGSMLAQINAARAAGHTLRGVLWWQGESDTAVDEATRQIAPGWSTWTADFTQFITDLRTDVGQPSLPVVFAQLGPEPSGLWAYAAWGGMQAHQAQISAPNVVMIETKDQPPKNYNNVHLADAGYAVVGRRMAEAMAAMQ